MNFIENKGLKMQQNELEIWLENLNNDVKNETIIFLNENRYISKSNVNTMGYSENLEYLKKCNYIIVKDKFQFEGKNFNKFFNLTFQKPIIIIKDKESIDKFVKLLQEDENDKKQEKIDIKYHLVNKKDFQELLHMDKNELINLLEKEHSYLYTFCPNFIYNEEFISLSIDTLKKSNILTASFANYLYKFAYLDFTANTTKVGREIRKLIGVKSKTINHYRTRDIYFPKGKPFKGYDLNTDKYLEIKKIIAQKLINLNDKKLDLDKIAEITELPIKEVKKLFNR
jgi:hypothetical protein